MVSGPGGHAAPGPGKRFRQTADFGPFRPWPESFPALSRLRI